MTGKAPSVRIALSVATVVALVLASSAFAGKGRGSGGASTSSSSSSLSLVMVNDANGNGLPNWGDTVTFKVSTAATTTPEVGTACYQNGAQVYYHEGGFYPGDPWAPADQMFKLQSYAWTSGAADCTATLFYLNRKLQEVNLATLSFHVNA